jgi:hypothetical protein
MQTIFQRVAQVEVRACIKKQGPLFVISYHWEVARSVDA